MTRALETLRGSPRGNRGGRGNGHGFKGHARGGFQNGGNRNGYGAHNGYNNGYNGHNGGYNTGHNGHNNRRDYEQIPARKGGKMHSERYDNHRGPDPRLVDEIKAAQKSPAWQRAWCSYCDQNADGTYDPSLHVTGFLRSALRDLGTPSKDDFHKDDLYKLIEHVKHNQKDPTWHTRWADYCFAYGEGTRDPSRHETGFLREALDFLSRPLENKRHKELNETIKNLQKQNPMWNAHWSRYCSKCSDGTRDPMFHESFFLASAIESLNKNLSKESNHNELVEKVKEQQRDDPTWRTRWADYCEDHANGTRDPAFHDAAYLKRALRDLAPVDATQRVGLRSSATNHEALVQEVKNLQRSDIRWQQRWIEYCEKRSDGTLNPMHHDAGFLRRAIQEISIKRSQGSIGFDNRGHEVQLLCEARRKAQRAKAFERADQLRSMLWEMGVEINDKNKTWRSDDGLSGTFRDGDDCY